MSCVYCVRQGNSGFWQGISLCPTAYFKACYISLYISLKIEKVAKSVSFFVVSIIFPAFSSNFLISAKVKLAVRITFINVFDVIRFRCNTCYSCYQCFLYIFLVPINFCYVSGGEVVKILKGFFKLLQNGKLLNSNKKRR